MSAEPGPEAVKAQVDRLLQALLELGVNEYRPEATQSLAGLIVGCRDAVRKQLEADRHLSAAVWDALGELANAVRDHLKKETHRG